MWCIDKCNFPAEFKYGDNVLLKTLQAVYSTVKEEQHDGDSDSTDISQPHTLNLGNLELTPSNNPGTIFARFTFQHRFVSFFFFGYLLFCPWLARKILRHVKMDSIFARLYSPTLFQSSLVSEKKSMFEV